MILYTLNISDPNVIDQNDFEHKFFIDGKYQHHIRSYWELISY